MTTDSSQRRSTGDADSGGRMSVLAVSTFRPAEVVNSVSEMDVESDVVHIDDSLGLLSRSLDTVRKTRRAIRTHDPDVVFLDCFEVTGAIVALLAFWYRIPLVSRLVGDTWRLLDEEGLQKAWAARDVRRLIRYRLSLLLNEFIYDRSAGFVVVSAALKDVVQERTGCPPDRIAVVPVPVTKDTWETGNPAAAREALGVEEDRVVLTVTNLLFRAKYDGVKQIVRELEPVLDRNPDLAYVIAGDGSHHGELEAFLDSTIDDPDTRRRIYTPGFVDEVSDLYALADIFAYVSYLDGYPNVVLEAQTAGLPVVANPAFGMREQITDGETGYLVQPDAPGEIRDRVESLLDRPDDRGCIGERARQRVERENAPEVIADALQAFLERLLTDDPSAPDDATTPAGATTPDDEV